MRKSYVAKHLIIYQLICIIFYALLFIHDVEAVNNIKKNKASGKVSEFFADGKIENQIKSEAKKIATDISNELNISGLNDAVDGSVKIKNNKRADKVIESPLPSVEAIYGNWILLSAKDENLPTKKKTFCYIVTKSIASIGNIKDKHNGYLIVIYANRVLQRVAISSGYLYRMNSKVNASVDGMQFTLLADRDLAWFDDIRGLNDNRMIKRMLYAQSVLVRSESSTGLYNVDTYLLVGFKEAYMRMMELCYKIRFT